MAEKTYEEELKENPPVSVKELPYRPGELIFAEMPEGDKFQLLVRYMNDIATFDKNSVILLAQAVQLLKYICESLGIDVVEKEKETTKKMKEQIEREIEEAKEKIKKVGN